MKQRTYMGVNIHDNSLLPCGGGYRLRWWAYTRLGMVSADTLQGIRSLIKDDAAKAKRSGWD